MTDEPAVVLDDYNLIPNGMIRFPIQGGGEVMLRRPRIGELREFMELLNGMNDQAADKSQELQAQGEADRRLLEAHTAQIEEQVAEALKADPIDDGRVTTLIAEKARLRAEASDRDRKASREFSQWSEALRVVWFETVMARLAMHALPEGLEPPPFVLDVKFPSDLVNHWRARPSRSGG
jgi:hypothetical protein